MSGGDARELLMEELDKIIRGPDLRFVAAWRKPSPPAPNYLTLEAPHFEIVLSGELPLILPCESGWEERVLRPGEAFHLAPGCGAGRLLDKDRDLIVVNLRKDGVECYHSQHRFKDGDSKMLRSSLHSSSPLEAPGAQLQLAFESYSREGREEMLMPVFRPLLMSVKESLAKEKSSSNERTFHSYKSVLSHLREKCGSPLSRKTVAAELGLSADYLTHLFRRCGNSGFHETLEELRMERAEKLLRQPQLNVAQTAELCGFEEPGYFIKVFRRRRGMTPGDFRAKALSSGSLNK